MQQWQYPNNSGLSIGPHRLTPAIKNIIIANVAVFLLMQMTGSGIGKFIHLFGLNPELVFTRFMIWQPVTYMFLHGGFMHIFMNMLMLWLFGTELETLWGERKFYRFYFITGIGSGVFSVVPYVIGVMTQGSSFSPSIIGASGAIYGVLLAYALTWPNRTVYLYFIMPVKVKHLMLFMGLITFFSIGNQDGVSHITHLGGLLIAWLYLRYRGNYRGFDLHLNWRHWLNKLKQIRVVNDKQAHRNVQRPGKQRNGDEWKRVERYPDDDRVELDRLLDKINRIGYEHLTEPEKKRLYELSQNIARHQPN